MNPATYILIASLVVFAGAVYLYARADKVRKDADQLVREERRASAAERTQLIERMAELADKPSSPPAGSRPRQEYRETETQIAWREAGVMPEAAFVE